MLHEVTVHHTVCTTASTVSPTCVQKSQIPLVSTNVKKLYCTESLLYVLNNQGYQRKDDL